MCPALVACTAFIGLWISQAGSCYLLCSSLLIVVHWSQPKTPASNFSDESMMGKPCALRVFSQTFLAARGLGGTRHAITLEVGRFKSHSTFSLARMSFHCSLSHSLSKTTRAWRCCPECIKLFRSFLLLIPPFVFLQIADEMSGGLHTQYFATWCSRRDGSYSAPFRRFWVTSLRNCRILYAHLPPPSHASASLG